MDNIKRRKMIDLVAESLGNITHVPDNDLLGVLDGVRSAIESLYIVEDSILGEINSMMNEEPTEVDNDYVEFDSFIQELAS